MHHYPVLLREVLEFLAVRPEGTYVDATVGAGGYAETIVRRLTSGRLIAMDADADALEFARERLEPQREKIRFHHGNFREIDQVVGADAAVDGVVADLGLSRLQLEDAGRGFAIQLPGPLDMRRDRRQELTAADIVNRWDPESLANLIFEFGEERGSRRIARAIIRQRPIRDTRHLAEVVAKAAARMRRGRPKIHPATKTFQALRIAVNDELGALERFLDKAPLLLRPGGRLVVVSFQSLEDRRVKVAFRQWAERGVLTLLNRRVVRPGVEEIRENPASRSARLRAAERTGTPWQQQPTL